TIEVAECLVWTAEGTAAAEYLKTQHGTASLQLPENAASKSGALILRPLAAILADHPRFQASRLLKSDTDGNDFDILMAARGWYRAHTPVLHFEYIVTVHKGAPRKASALIETLLEAGYAHFLVYDNFGHYLDTISDDAVARFDALNHYLLS